MSNIEIFNPNKRIMPLLPKPDNSGNYELMYEGNDPLTVCMYEAAKETIICKCHQVFDHPSKFIRHLKEIHNVTNEPNNHRLKIHQIDDNHKYALLDLGDYNDCYTKMVICGTDQQIDEFVLSEFLDRGYNESEINDLNSENPNVYQTFTDDQEQQVDSDDPRLDSENKLYDPELAENFESFESQVEFGINIYPLDSNEELFDEIYHVCYAYSGFIDLSNDEIQITQFDDLGSEFGDQRTASDIEPFNSMEETN